MPLYTYGCSVHGDFEDFNSFDNYDKRSNCPICKKPSLRLPSLGVAINMNGVTHYSGKSIRKTQRSILKRTDIELRTEDMMDSVNKFKNRSKMRS